MRNFIEKSIIISFSLYASYKFTSKVDLVFYFLVAIVFSSLLDILSNKKHKFTLYLLFIALIFYNNIFLFYLPLILYNMYIDFKFYSFLALTLLFLDFYPVILILSALSIYFSESSSRIERTIREDRYIRDSLKEDALYLKKYNEQIIIDKEKDIQIAILTERNRIAREIHDSIGHSISSSILQVKALKLMPKDSLEEHLDLLQRTLSNGMNDIRRSLQGLRDESLDLKSRIDLLIDEVPELEVDILYNMEDDLPYELKFDILSIIKEAITNTIKHSNARRLKIQVLDQPRFYSIAIEDNGDKVPDYESKGIGLDYMDETARKHNGSFNYKFDKGFKIHVTLMKGK